MNSINHNQPGLTIQIPHLTPRAQASVVFVHPDSRRCPPALLLQLIHNTTQTRLLIQQLKNQLDAALKRD
jgi:hypothetical protein